MKNKIFILLCISLIAGGAFISPAQQRFTLKDCIEIGVRNNLEIKESRLVQRGASVDIKLAKSLYLPSLTGNMGDTYNWGLFVDPSTNLLTTQNNEIIKGSVQAELELFNGGFHYYNLKESKELYSSAVANTEKVENDIKFLIISAFFNAFLSKEQVKFAERQITAAEQQETSVKGMQEAGVLHLRDFAQVHADLSLRDAEKLYAENGFRSNYMILQQLLGLEEGEFSLVDSFPEVVPETLDVISIQSLKETGQKNLPEVRAAESMLKASKYRVNRFKSLRYPSLSFSGGIITRSSSLQSVEQNVQFRNNLSQFAAFSLSIPLFQGFRTNLGIEQAEVNYRIQENKTRLVQQLIDKRIFDAYQNLLAAHKRYWALVSKEQAFSQQYEYYQSSFLSGLISYTEYFVIYSQWTTTQIELLQAKYQYFMYNEQYKFFQNPDNYLK